MDMKHTPTPWKVGPGFSVMAGRYNVAPTITAGGSSKGMSDERTVASANAAFIVRAANSHEPMKAALIAVRNEVAGSTKPFSSDSYLPAHIVEQIDAALVTAGA